MKKAIILCVWVSTTLFFSSCATLKKNDNDSNYARNDRSWFNESSDRDKLLSDSVNIEDEKNNSGRWNDRRDKRESQEDERYSDRGESRNTRGRYIFHDDPYITLDDRNYNDRRSNEKYYPLRSDEDGRRSFDDRRRNDDSRYEEDDRRDSRYGDRNNANQSRRSLNRDDQYFNQRYDEDDKEDRYSSNRRGDRDERARFNDEDDRYTRRDQRRTNRYNRDEDWRSNDRSDLRDRGAGADIIRLEAIVGYELDNLDSKIRNFRDIQTNGKRRKRKLAKEEVSILEEHRGELFKLYREVNTANSSNFSLVKSEVEKRLAMIREYVPNPEIYLR